MHDEILNDAQRGLLPLMSQFRREFYLVADPPSDGDVKAALTSLAVGDV